ncbi:SH3 domain-containing protein, partial [Acinetobacter baumannii]|nr:SH3 domain-containing protein [Acinetobacter baumannii]
MKKYLKFIVFTAFMIGSIKASYADFGFIQDKDGYVNVRKNSSLS